MMTLDSGTRWLDATPHDMPMYPSPDLEWPDPAAELRIQPLIDRFELQVIGEIDLSTRGSWEQALSETVEAGFDVHLDLSGLTFTDVAGVGLLVAASERLTRGRRLLIHHPPKGWQLIFDLFWPGGVPGIEVVSR